MSNNEIVKIRSTNSVVKVSNLISLTKKLLNEINGNGIVLYNLSEFNLQRKTEIVFINFIKKNIWLFLPRIITHIKNDKLSSEPYPLDFIIFIEKHDINYEYPRSFYRTRGTGKTLVNREYDRQLIEKNEQYNLCSPPLDKAFENMIFENITCFIAGTIITEYADTSIGVVLGLKYKRTDNY